MPKEDIIKVMQIYDDIINILDNVLVGQSAIKKAVVASLLCSKNSRVLLMGDTGAGKTTLANFLANSFNHERISVTSDLIPSEIIEQLKNNVNIEFLQIDEFNRASGKVQSAFIELFEESQINVNGHKYSFKDFYCFATENNYDITGIFNVPEAIYDRFDISLLFDALTEEDKRKLLFGDFTPNTSLKIDLKNRDFVVNTVDNFLVKKEDANLFMQMFNIIDTLMYNKEKIFIGTNIRAHKYAIKLAKLNALIDGRDYILPRDLAFFVDYLYNHRIIKNNDIPAQELLNDAKTRILRLKK